MNKLKLCYIVCLIVTIILIISFINIANIKANVINAEELEKFNIDNEGLKLYAEEIKEEITFEEFINNKESLDTEVSALEEFININEEDLDAEEIPDILPIKELILNEAFSFLQPKIVTKYISVSEANIRLHPNKNSKILGTINWNKKVKGYVYNGWLKLLDTKGYIRLNLLSDNKAKYTDKSATIRTNVKCYMPISAITCKSSYQYKIRKHYAYTGEYGISQVYGRFCCALGSYYGVSIGQYFDLILENGNVIPCIAGDAKADCDTDKATHSYTKYNKCMTEFIIGSTRILNQYIHRSGNVSSINEFNSPVKTIRIYKKSCFE